LKFKEFEILTQRKIFRKKVKYKSCFVNYYTQIHNFVSSPRKNVEAASNAAKHIRLLLIYYDFDWLQTNCQSTAIALTNALGSRDGALHWGAGMAQW